MNKPLSFTSLGLVSILALGSCDRQKQDPEPPRSPEEDPNIVILFADDLGYGDLGVYGHPTIKTPHLDEMAQQGMKFTQFYVAATVSTPSRGALLTGRYPVRTGIHSGVYFPDSEMGIPQEEVTVAEALGEAGYATACYGKWHLGHKPQYLPTNHGFDDYFGIPYSNDMSPVYNTEWERARSFPKTPLLEDTTVIESGVDQRELTKRYTSHAAQFIRDHQEEPFFLYLPYTFPHIPLFASKAFQDTSKRGLYGDVVQEIDWSVGKILQTLEDLGLEKNTLVFFTSDNGPWLSQKLEGGSAGLLRGGKGSCWEGGMREPAIAWWPGTIEAGQVTSAMATTMDLFTTSLMLGGTQPPQDRVIDGKDLTPLLKGQTNRIHDVFFYYRGDKLYAVRKGPWKAHFITVENRYLPNQEVIEHDPPLLFNIEEDPSAKYNVADKHPAILEELSSLAERHKGKMKIKPSVVK